MNPVTHNSNVPGGKFFPRLDEKKVVFVTPPSAFNVYTGTAINAATQIYPYLPYQCLSAWLKRLNVGLKTAALDMDIKADPWCALAIFLLRERPKYIGLSFTSPLFFEASLIGLIAKSYLGPDAMVIHGGIHASALPHESLNETMCDVVVVSEGEETFGELCQGKPLQEIKGIVYRADSNRKQLVSAYDILQRLKADEPCYTIHCGAVHFDDADIKRTLPRGFLRNKENRNLDDVPFPDMELFDIRRYHNPPVIARGYPMQQVETSRGCQFACNFCSAEDTYRVFSADYTVALYEYLINHCGVRELRVIDDQFLTHIKRGKIIVEKMLQKGIVIPWNMANGVRADRVDREFLALAARSGCYQIGGGYESGDQAALDSLNKLLNIDKSVTCMQMIKEAGIETVGFFMFGAKADTPESMDKTIAFAKALMPDFAKVTICIPFPDMRLFAEYDRQGLILSRKWGDYNIHKAVGVYRHPNGLSPEVLTQYYWKFYREFYGNSDYLKWFIPKSIANGSVVWKVCAARKLT